MFSLSYDEIISKIIEEKNLSEEEIAGKIKDKLRQLSDLISKEGAAHIVANELGVKIVGVARDVKVDKLIEGMNNVNLVGKVVKINDVISYNKNGRSGKVVSFILGDDTGVVRGVLWDTNHIKEVENGSIKQESILKMKNGYVRLNNGYKEIHLGNSGELEVNPEGVDIEVNNIPSFDFTRKKIIELNEGDNNIGVFGTIVQIFEPRFYEACPQCGKKVELMGDSRQCKEHGLIEAQLIPILNIFFDDGSDNLRAVAFRNQVGDLLGVSMEQVLEFKDDQGKFEAIKQDILGKQVFLVGRINKNEMFDRKEMSIQRVVEAEPEKILKGVENKDGS